LKEVCRIVEDTEARTTPESWKPGLQFLNFRITVETVQLHDITFQGPPELANEPSTYGSAVEESTQEVISIVVP
jgi:hypothetical protein